MATTENAINVREKTRKRMPTIMGFSAGDSMADAWLKLPARGLVSPILHDSAVHFAIYPHINLVSISGNGAELTERRRTSVP